jgi:hypothetical protein
VRLVDHDEADGAGEARQHLGAEAGVGQPFGADRQQVDLVGRDAGLDLGPVVEVRRVDRGRPHAHALGGGDLVAHQGQQGRHDQRRAGAAIAQEARGDEVDRRLAEAGPLHDERPAARVDHGLDRRRLVGTQPRVGAGEDFEHLLGTGRGVAHARPSWQPPVTVDRRGPGTATAASAAAGGRATIWGVGRPSHNPDRHPDHSQDDPHWLGPVGRGALAALDAVASWMAPSRTLRRLVTVPDFCGQLASERSLIAVRAGVRTRCVSTTPRPSGDGIVVAQEPPAGTVVRRSTEVVLTVAHLPRDPHPSPEPTDREPMSS